MRQYDFQIPILFHVLQSMTITRLTACFVWPNTKSKCRAQVRMRKLVSSWVHHSNHSKSQGIATSMPGHSWFLGGSERKPWCVAQGRSCDTDFLPIFQGAMGHASNPYSSCTCAPVEGDGGMWASLSQGDLVRTLEQGRECKAGRNPGDWGEEWAAWE